MVDTRIISAIKSIYIKQVSPLRTPLQLLVSTPLLEASIIIIILVKVKHLFTCLSITWHMLAACAQDMN